MMTPNKKVATSEIILEAELNQAREELQDLQEKESYTQKHYTVSGLSAEVFKMVTGLPTREVFNIVVLHALRFKDFIFYYSGWKVESINFEDQIFITLMKLRQNYLYIKDRNPAQPSWSFGK